MIPMGITSWSVRSMRRDKFPRERDARAYLFAHVCLDCRKSFKKPLAKTPRVCPQCSNSLVQVSRKFKVPKARDVAQWAKVRFLIEHGFLFYSVYERSGHGEIKVPYPRTLAEAKEFVRVRKRQAYARSKIPKELTYSLRDLPVLRR